MEKKTYDTLYYVCYIYIQDVNSVSNDSEKHAECVASANNIYKAKEIKHFVLFLLNIFNKPI